ncbi:MAG: carbamoyltransferase HypF [Legionellales bacterium RIFCSPHIGHO2_12_FULL_42_9]|nr:MAG: carbamoyltransferase HypF [Legionellales bacterium RIFCSPHIGHO2_12_FULL_42_9]
MERLQIVITGLVQSVGFRPHVYQVANLLGLTGWVQNNPSGVLIEVQGISTITFLPRLTESLPSLARIDDIKTKNIPLYNNEKNFKIIPSKLGESRTMISPDVSICSDCLHELFDSQSRYYQYPFLNCTQCGPRLTITRNLPYDRDKTSMDVFPLCIACRNDYQDPGNRRYHAQPTACAKCGPQLSSSIDVIAQAIIDGQIIALKGLGGYQLICDARNETAIDILRQRKHRKAKPFALMVAHLRDVESIAEVDNDEQELLMSVARPIVLLKQRDFTLPQSIAPNLSHLGIMLPSTPLHYLLFDALENTQSSILVVTSANLGGEPLIIDDIDAKEKLTSIADLIISYNRQIVTRADDSVMRMMNHSPMFIRRARGFVPQRIKLPYSIPPTLALGGHLKNTFCITRDDEAFVSQHIGSLTNKPTIEFFHESLTHWMQFLDVKIERIACDLHPDFYTTQLAHDYNLPVVTVQHHHAHLASVASEHHILQPALGLALDGYGYGLDGNAWGGELLLFDKTYFQKLGSFLPLPAPGGDIVAREPWRMAASVLQQLNLNHRIVEKFSSQPQAPLLAHLLKTNRSMPLTSSCGRLFDAASALLGINPISTYEGQAALQLESLVTELEVLPNGWYVEEGQFNLLPTFHHLLNINPIMGANVFHGTMIAGLTDWLAEAATNLSTDIIVLSGGCFLNKVLTDGLYHGLHQRGFKVYLPKQLPPNDGGLSLGQAWITGTKRENSCV